MDDSDLRSQLLEHHEASYGWALSLCAHDPDEAADVLQTSYLKILEGRARFSGRSAFRTWLFAVIRKTAIDARRRGALHRLLLFQHRERLVPQPGIEPGAGDRRSQLRRMFRRALADLSERQREVLGLVFYHELTIAEAAEVMGVSIGSARTHYERGKKRLRQWIETARVDDASKRP